MKDNLLQNLIIEKSRPLNWYLKSVREKVLFLNQSNAIFSASLYFVILVLIRAHTPGCAFVLLSGVLTLGAMLTHFNYCACTLLGTWDGI